MSVPRSAIGLLVIIFSTPATLLALELQSLRSALESEKYDEAYVLATSMAKEAIGDPDFDFLYGVAAQKSSHPEAAIFALERVLMTYPDHIDALFVRGLALIEVKDLKGAKAVFQRLLNLKARENVRADAQQFLAHIEQSTKDGGKRTHLFLQSALDVGFNSNVNAGSPGLSEFPRSGPEVRDGFANLGISLLVKRDFSKSESYFLALATNNRKNFRSQDWDYNTLEGRTGLEFRPGPFSIRVPAQMEALFVNYTPQRFVSSIGLEVGVEWDKDVATSLSSNLSYRVYNDSANSFVTIPIALKHEWFSVVRGLDLSGRFYYAPGIAIEAEPGPTVHSELGGTLSANFLVARTHALVPMVGVTYYHYPVNIEATQVRDDVTFITQLRYDWRFAEDWYLSPAFTYSFNRSSDSGQGYTRYEALVGLRYEI